jgi:colanic acid/amylovoran biosynthesis glycosyltransferase
MSTKRIGIVLPSVPGYSETFFRSKIVGLKKNGFDVVLFVKNPKGAKGFICPVYVHPKIAKNGLIRFIQSFTLFFTLILKAPKPTFRLISLMRSKGFSLLQGVQSAVIGSAILPHKLDWLHFGFATPAIQREFLGPAVGAKVAVSFRGFDLNQTPLQEKDVYKLFWPYVDKVHSISNYLVKKAHAIGLPESTPYKIITPAINASEFISDPPSVKPNTILLVSRLHWIKGIEHVLKAIQLVRQSVKDIEVTIVGEGEERERLIFAAYQLGILDCVNFIGRQPHSRIKHYMQSNEIFVQFSFQEGFCNAALEAQAAQMLCIVSDAEGLQENVLDGQTGWVVPKRNPEALANKILEVMAMPYTKKQEVRLAARKRIEADFRIEKQEQAFVDFYA